MNNDMPELIFEIGTEELPAGYIDNALADLERAAATKFKGLELHHGPIISMGTPRRLALVVQELQGRQQDTIKEYIGPSVQAGFDDQQQPTRAAEGFARSRGVTVEALQVVHTAKGDYLMVAEKVQGQSTRELLPEVLTSLVRELVFPKSMRWGNSELTFARPIQWLLAVYGGEKVGFCLEDLHAAEFSRGHRFMAPEAFAVTDSGQYREELRKRHVIVDPAVRQEMVTKAVEEAVAGQCANGCAMIDADLLDTVTNLVETPWGVCGRFAEKFLKLPDAVLITSMREHQKYFPVCNADGRLLPFFVAVNNTRVADQRLAAQGHERVLRARLEDAFFFFHEDRKKRLDERLAELDGIIFQNHLGTMAAKSERLMRLAGLLARQLAPNQEAVCRRAARLAKVDLLTEMVGEFPSLQGVMGREYARLDGELPEVAIAISEHYLPVRAGDELPATLAGALVGLADRMDTLVGCFGLGERPTGNKDAFGLRRKARGLISIIRGHALRLDLRDFAGQALKGYGDILEIDARVVEDVVDFIRLRFENELMATGLRLEVVEAASRVRFDDLLDCLNRVKALDQMRGLDTFGLLAGSFKRINNIVRENTTTDVDPQLFEEEAERDLYGLVEEVRQQAEPLLRKGDYLAALEAMVKVKGGVDRFFDEVMVMAEEARLRQNRLNLLTRLRALFFAVGDIGRMHVEKKE